MVTYYGVRTVTVQFWHQNKTWTDKGNVAIELELQKVVLALKKVPQKNKTQALKKIVVFQF